MPTTFSNLPRPWRCIARFESSDRVVPTNPSSGDQGAFQIDPRTWLEYAPVTFPATPNAATLLEQFTVAQRIQSADGFHPWQTASLCPGTGIVGV